jgi:hypothetical protein
MAITPSSISQIKQKTSASPKRGLADVLFRGKIDAQHIPQAIVGTVLRDNFVCPSLLCAYRIEIRPVWINTGAVYL